MMDERRQQVIKITSKFPDGAGIDDIHAELEEGVSIRTLQRWLKQLADEGLIEINGAARATTYSSVHKDINGAAEKPENRPEPLIPLSVGG